VRKVIHVAIAMRDGPDVRLLLLRFGEPIMPHTGELHELADLVRWREGESAIAFAEKTGRRPRR
jgi:hypothetical protein